MTRIYQLVSIFVLFLSFTFVLSSCAPIKKRAGSSATRQHGSAVENLNKCYEGWALFSAGAAPQAIQLFEQCIKEGNLSKSSLARTYRNLGMAYQSRKEFEKAIEFYSKAIKLDPSDVINDYVNRGNAYDEAKMFDKAMKDYDKALEINPGYGPVFYNRGIAYEHQRRWKDAKKEFSAAYDAGLRRPELQERLMLHGLIKK